MNARALIVAAGLALGETWAARAQIQSPPICQEVTIDHEVFRTRGRHAKLLLTFHTSDGPFVSRWALTTPRRFDATGGSCTSGAAVDLFTSELLKNSGQFLPH